MSSATGRDVSGRRSSAPDRKRSTETAARRPPATAAQTDAGPLTASPAANTPSHELSSVSGDTVIRPRVIFTSCAKGSRSLRCPMAKMTVSALKKAALSGFSSKVGAKRPASSRRERQRRHSRPTALPSGPTRTAVGPHAPCTGMPMPTASATLCGKAGSSS